MKIDVQVIGDKVLSAADLEEMNKEEISHKFMVDHPEIRNALLNLQYALARSGVSWPNAGESGVAFMGDRKSPIITQAQRDAVIAFAKFVSAPPEVVQQFIKKCLTDNV